MGVWLDHLREAAGGGEPSVIVTVAAVRGSAPREPGAGMVITATRVRGTIGGGNLEFMAIDRARGILAGECRLPEGGEVCRYALGTNLGQCCGGVAFLHYEAFSSRLPAWIDALGGFHDAGEAAVLLSRPAHPNADPAVVTSAGFQGAGPVDETIKAAEPAARSALNGWEAGRDLLWSSEGRRPSASNLRDFVLMRPVLVGELRVVVFGAGHVGRALVRVLEPLADRIVWCDGRENEFPSALPPNAHAHGGDPFAIIDSMPPQTFFLVMTHSHSLDLALCEAVLQRGDYAYLGLIGSRSKRRRFEKHLREEGLTEADLDRMICPIGVEGIRSKEPAAIAVSVAAQLLRVSENLRGKRTAA